MSFLDDIFGTGGDNKPASAADDSIDPSDAFGLAALGVGTIATAGALAGAAGTAAATTTAGAGVAADTAATTGVAGGAGADVLPAGAAATGGATIGTVPGSAAYAAPAFTQPAVAGATVGTVPGSAATAASTEAGSATTGISPTAAKSIGSLLINAGKGVSSSFSNAQNKNDELAKEPIEETTTQLKPLPQTPSIGSNDSMTNAIFGPTPISQPQAYGVTPVSPQVFQSPGIVPMVQSPQPITSDINKKKNIASANRSLKDFLTQIRTLNG